MRKVVFRSSVVGILAAVLLSAGPVFAEAAGGDVKLSGTFNWTSKKGQEFPIEAVLTPSGANEWKVTFTFNWDKKPNTWTGTVKGGLENGEISGDSTFGKRTFTFKGTVKDRLISFQHQETTGNKPQNTGSCVLKPAVAKPAV